MKVSDIIVKRCILVICTIVIASDAFMFVNYFFYKDRVLYRGDPIDYYLSKSDNEDDSLFYYAYYDLLRIEERKPSISGLINADLLSRECYRDAKCIVFLSHAKSKDDSLYIKQVMLKDFDGTSSKSFREDMKERNSIVKKYLNIK